MDPVEYSEREENEEPAGVEGIDPFGEEAVKQVQLIVQMRIYDALMAVLAQLDGRVADELSELHAQGKVVGALPLIDLSE